MPCEKLYYAYHAELERYLCVQATPGNVELRDVAVPLVQRVLSAGRPRRLHALFDAGAGKADADVRGADARADGHAAGLPLPPPGPPLETTAERLVYRLRGAGRLCRRAAQGAPRTHVGPFFLSRG
jgi:hypothetical protein